MSADFNVQWPSFGYWVKAGFAATIGVVLAGIVVAIPLGILNLAFMSAFIRAVMR